MPSLTGLSNKEINKTDKYWAKNIIWKYWVFCKGDFCFIWLLKNNGPRSITQGRVQVGGSGKAGGRSQWCSKLLLQALPLALPFRTSFPNYWFSLVSILHPMVIPLVSISTQFLQMEISLWTELQVFIWVSFWSSLDSAQLLTVSEPAKSTYSMPLGSSGQVLWTQRGI